MKRSPAVPPSIDELASKTVRLGREVHQIAQSVHVGGSTRHTVFVDRSLRRLAEREPFDVGDDASLAALSNILDADLQSEVVGTERRFLETHYDDLGQHGEVRDCPLYSDRGQQLLRLKDTLSRFMAARDATLDRLAAERAILRLLRT